jgi:hypothetical protein
MHTKFFYVQSMHVGRYSLLFYVRLWECTTSTSFMLYFKLENHNDAGAQRKERAKHNKNANGFEEEKFTLPQSCDVVLLYGVKLELKESERERKIDDE